MDVALALQNLESALRLIIRDLLADGWRAHISDLGKLESKRAEEVKRRDGAIADQDLLAYVEFHQLIAIIRKEWDAHFHKVFKDKKRTEVWLETMADVLDVTDKTRTEVRLEAVADVRNAIAHSRELIPFERDLVSGISGQLRNQISIYRTDHAPVSAHYPVIESVVDDLGNAGKEWDLDAMVAASVRRVEVGETVTITCRATDPSGRSLEWLSYDGEDWASLGTDSQGPWTGADVVITWEPNETNVREAVALHVMVRTVEGRFHRYRDNDGVPVPCDDRRVLKYAVNPPVD